MKPILDCEEFLLNPVNKPDFLVVRLEHERQLLKKLKTLLSLRLGSAVVEKHDLLPAFRTKAYQENLYLSYFKEFSLAEKLAHFLSKAETDKLKLPPFQFSIDDLRSTVARFEYYLIFPFLILEDKENVFSPERGISKYCRSVFDNKDKYNWDLNLCSDKVENSPLLLRAKVVSVSTAE